MRLIGLQGLVYGMVIHLIGEELRLDVPPGEGPWCGLYWSLLRGLVEISLSLIILCVNTHITVPFPFARMLPL